MINISTLIPIPAMNWNHYITEEWFWDIYRKIVERQLSGYQTTFHECYTICFPYMTMEERRKSIRIFIKNFVLSQGNDNTHGNIDYVLLSLRIFELELIVNSIEKDPEGELIKLLEFFEIKRNESPIRWDKEFWRFNIKPKYAKFVSPKAELLYSPKRTLENLCNSLLVLASDKSSDDEGIETVVGEATAGNPLIAEIVLEKLMERRFAEHGFEFNLNRSNFESIIERKGVSNLQEDTPNLDKSKSNRNNSTKCEEDGETYSILWNLEAFPINGEGNKMVLPFGSTIKLEITDNLDHQIIETDDQWNIIDTPQEESSTPIIHFKQPGSYYYICKNYPTIMKLYVKIINPEGKILPFYKPLNRLKNKLLPDINFNLTFNLTFNSTIDFQYTQKFITEYNRWFEVTMGLRKIETFFLNKIVENFHGPLLNECPIHLGETLQKIETLVELLELKSNFDEENGEAISAEEQISLNTIQGEIKRIVD